MRSRGDRLTAWAFLLWAALVSMVFLLGSVDHFEVKLHELGL